MIPQEEIDRIKSQIDLRTLVSGDLGNPYGSNKNPMFFKSPFRTERSASFAVYPDHATDYGDPSGGPKHNGVYDHISYLQCRLSFSFKEAIEHLRKLIGGPSALPEHQPIQRTPEKPKRINPKQVEWYSKNLELVSPYLEQRAIPFTTAMERKIGGEIYSREYFTVDNRRYEFSCRRVTIPYFAGNNILSLEFRRDELSVREYINAHPGIIDVVRIDLAAKKGSDPESIDEEEVLTVMFCGRYWRPSGVHPHIYGLNSVVEQHQNGKFSSRKIPWALISEGAIDAISAQAAGFRTAIGIKANNNIDIKTILKGSRIKYIVQDNDKDSERPNGDIFNPGLEHATRLYEQLGGDPTVQIIRIPSPYKDLNDLARAGILTDFLSSKPFRIYPDEIQF